jgi:hypothetical protein
MNWKDRLIQNAIRDGWKVKQTNNTYTFTKRHDNIKEYFDPLYICTFIKKYK